MKELKRYIEQGQVLLEIDEPVEAHSQFGNWLNNVTNWLSLKAPQSGLADAWRSIGTSSLLVGSRYYNDKASWNIFRSVVRQRMAWLQKINTDLIQSGRVPLPSKPPKPAPTRVHVHGPEGPLRDEVLGVLKKLGIPSLSPVGAGVPPSGPPGQGLDFSQIAFVVILFTQPPQPSSGRLAAAVSTGADPVLQSVLELGFFLGKVGAKRICALAEPGLTVDLDAGQILFVDADSAGAWQIALARSLKRAGIPLDMNRVL